VNKLSYTALVLSLAACQPDTKNLEKKIDDMAKDIRELRAQVAKGGGGGGAGAQQQRQAREEADPAAVFAVDISQNVKLGMVEGPPSAMVTIVEAWDFA
jgi:outer membrane murein-binding lipoprotein Lpp